MSCAEGTLINQLLTGAEELPDKFYKVVDGEVSSPYAPCRIIEAVPVFPLRYYRKGEYGLKLISSLQPSVIFKEANAFYPPCRSNLGSYQGELISDPFANEVIISSYLAHYFELKISHLPPYLGLINNLGYGICNNTGVIEREMAIGNLFQYWELLRKQATASEKPESAEADLPQDQPLSPLPVDLLLYQLVPMLHFLSSMDFTHGKLIGNSVLVFRQSVSIDYQGVKGKWPITLKLHDLEQASMGIADVKRRLLFVHSLRPVNEQTIVAESRGRNGPYYRSWDLATLMASLAWEARRSKSLIFRAVWGLLWVEYQPNLNDFPEKQTYEEIVERLASYSLNCDGLDDALALLTRVNVRY